MASSTWNAAGWTRGDHWQQQQPGGSGEVPGWHDGRDNQWRPDTVSSGWRGQQAPGWHDRPQSQFDSGDWQCHGQWPADQQVPLEQQAQAVFPDRRAVCPAGRGGDPRGYRDREEADEKWSPPHLTWRVLTYATLNDISRDWWDCMMDKMEKGWMCTLTYRKKRTAIRADSWNIPWQINLRGHEVASAFDEFLHCLFDEQGDIATLEDLCGYPVPDVCRGHEVETQSGNYCYSGVREALGNWSYQYHVRSDEDTVTEMRRMRFVEQRAMGVSCLFTRRKKRAGSGHAGSARHRSGPGGHAGPRHIL